ncbi:SAVED domain-containing protein [Flagellimonas flava]|uniref:SMODS-associated and fused to various effectors domain-containing protein n=1 Tax=Flagellimonas flava TaxID=570519 RepID=A0A1M5IRH9_9FLAO|nr:SAVED domain-containing protein [Allomuricauda flava]SHG30846.1 hypothetical protein SAMN04488116_0880 [Allomuricauda flava]
MKEKLIIIAHSGLEKKISKEECLSAISNIEEENVVFIHFDITEVKLSDLYDLPYEQLALEQQRRFKLEIEPILRENSNSRIAYFGLAPIPLAIHLGYLCSNYNQYLFYQYHHKKNEWYLEIEKPKNYNFKVKEIIGLPDKVEKGKGEVFIRVGTSFRIEPQHSLEVLPNPTNEFDLTLEQPHVDGISNQNEVNEIVDSFQVILSAYSNFLPDKDKIHLFVASTTAVAFAIGTRINPNIYPYIQTYQFSRDENPKYREAILIDKSSDDVIAYTEDDRKMAAEIRKSWEDQLQNDLKTFIGNSEGLYGNWLDHITQKESNLKDYAHHLWIKLPQLFSTSLKNDSIDLDENVVGDGFDYDKTGLKWKIDDGMFVSLNSRLGKIEGANILQAGRLFLFHEGLHYCPEAHNLIGSIANGIGQFPKVIEEADYQADTYALLYDYKFSKEKNIAIEQNLKKFFLMAIDTATETMWSFIDNGVEINELNIRSINRFLNWYWQWVRIEQLKNTGTLKEIIEILFDKPVIEFAGPPPFILNQRRVAIKLNTNSLIRYELAIFHNNKIVRGTPTGIDSIVDGFKKMDSSRIKDGLRSFLSMVSN